MHLATMGQSSSPPPSPSLSDGAEPTLGQLFLSGSTNVKGDIQSFLARLARSPQVLAEEAKEHHARTHRRIRRRRKPSAAAAAANADADAAHDSPQPPPPRATMQPQQSAAQQQQQQQRQRPLWAEPITTTNTITTQQQQQQQQQHPSPAHADLGPPRKRARPTLARAPQPHAVDDHGVLRRAPPVPILPQQQQQQQQQQHHRHHHQLRDEPELDQEPRHHQRGATKREEQLDDDYDDDGDEEGRYRARERHHSTPAFLSRPEPTSSPSLPGGSSTSMPDLGHLLQGFPSFPYAHQPSPSPASLLNDSLSLDVNRLIYDIGDYCLSLCSDISLICSSPPPPPASPAPPLHSAFSRPFLPSSAASSTSMGSSSSSSSSSSHHQRQHQQYQQYQQQQQLHHGGIGHGPPHTACPSSPAISRPPQSPYTTTVSSSQCSSAVSSPYLPSPQPSFTLGVTVSSPPALQDQAQASAGRHPTFPMRTSFYAEEPFYQPAPATPEEASYHSRHAAQPHHRHHLSIRRHQPQARDNQGETLSEAPPVAQMSEADEVAALIRDFLEEEGEAPEDTQFDSSLLYSSPTGRSRRRPTPPSSSHSSSSSSSRDTHGQ